MQEFQLIVRTPFKILIEEKVTWASFLMNQGMVTIYAHHAIIMGETQEGEIKYQTGTQVKTLPISSGFVKVTGETVELLLP